MLSNKELIHEANILARELGLDVSTDGLKNQGLMDLVSDLKAKKTDARKDTRADYAKPMPAFYVAPGRSLTSKRGILSGDSKDEIRAADLAGGEDALQAFVDSGHVLKGE